MLGDGDFSGEGTALGFERWKFETFKSLKTTSMWREQHDLYSGQEWVCTENRKKLDLIGVGFFEAKLWARGPDRLTWDDFDSVLKYKCIQEEMGCPERCFNAGDFELAGILLTCCQSCITASRSFFGYRNRAAQTVFPFPPNPSLSMFV